MAKLRGIPIGNFKDVKGKDGRVRISEDIDAKHRKLDVSTRIAAKANSKKKKRYGKPLLQIPAGKRGE